MKRLIALTGALWMAFAMHAAAWEIGDDGLHKEEWFSLTFKDIAEDIETAKENGKRLALIVEQRGCIYCKEIHEVVLADPEVRDYIKEHFMVVQYNMHGSEEVTDTDGDVLTEKQAAKKWRLLFTPTVMFMPEDPPEDMDAGEAAVAMMPGAFKKGTFLEMFIWVNDKGYEGEESFQTYYNRRYWEKRGGQPGAEE